SGLQSHARANRHSDMVGRYRDLAEARGYNPTHGHSVIPTFSATCIPYTVVELQSHARALRHSDQKGYQPMNYTTLLQSHARAIRHSDAEKKRRGLIKQPLLQSHARAIRHSDSCNHRSFGDAEIVTIPRTGNPSFRLLQPSFFRRCGDCYNPTHGQSVIPTPATIVLSAMRRLLQSHARAIRHSDSCNHRSFGDAEIVTIPRTGNPSFRRTGGKNRLRRPCMVTIPRSGNPSFRLLAVTLPPTSSNVTIPRTGNPSFRPMEVRNPYEETFRYNPTHGQSVIPTSLPASFIDHVAWLQSHARAIRHSDLACFEIENGAKMVTIPRTGNPSFRQQQRLPNAQASSCYNPTHGQSVIPTPSMVAGGSAWSCYNPTHGQSVIPTRAALSCSDWWTDVTIPRTGNPSFRHCHRYHPSWPPDVTIPRTGNPSFRPWMIVLSPCNSSVTIPRTGNPSFRL